MVNISCENCLNLKVVPRNHRVYGRHPDAKCLVNCKANITMAYHEYAVGSQKYKETAEECSNFDDMDELED
jgi:hypothetical protein